MVKNLTLAFAVWLLSLFAFVSFGANNLSGSALARRIASQVWSYPQEKVYVTTNMDGYISGDTIRLRAFLLDASTNRTLINGSQYIYIDLIDPFGQAVERIKLKSHNGVFAGIIALDEGMAEGVYTLGAYTQFMKNSGEDFFFRKAIPVKSNLTRKYDLQTEIKSNELFATLLEKGDGPVRAENVMVYDNTNTPIYQARRQSDIKLKLKRRILDSGVVKIKFDRYERFITLPVDSTSLYLSFYPEGGYLIPGRDNKVAFKATDSRGHGVDVQGFIIDMAGDTVCSFSTEHQGMGLVSFIPKEQNEYRAIAGDEVFPLPKPSEQATVINIENLNTDSIAVKIAGELSDKSFLLAHNCGTVKFAHTLFPNSSVVVLDKHNLGSGVVQFLLVDKDGNTLSSRMIFNHSDYIYTTDSITPMPIGDYSIRTFSDKIQSRQPERSIISYLLLESELKGHIENPDYYFQAVDSTKLRHMDILMMTHGWERYNIPEVLTGNIVVTPDEPMEIGGEITGTVRSRWSSKPLEGASVLLVAPSIGFTDIALSDSIGRFVFNRFDWPDGTKFAFTVYNKNGKREHNFTIDKDSFPSVPPLMPKLGAISYAPVYASPILDAILLDEIQVTAPKPMEKSRQEMLSALGIRTVTANDMQSKHISTYEEVIYNIPGLRIVNGNIVSTSVRSSIYNRSVKNQMVELWVDGVQWIPGFGKSSGSMLPQYDKNIQFGNAMPTTTTYTESLANTLSEFAASYPLDMVESIQYLRSSSALIISSTAANGAGALVITTKKGFEDKKTTDQNIFIQTIMPKGYQDAAETFDNHFIYDATSGNDKGIIHGWYPVVTAPDSIRFPADHTIVVEGISEDNHPVFRYTRL